MTWNPHGKRAVCAAARPRRPVPVVAAVLLALAERGAAVRGVLPGHRGLRRRLAVLLLRLDAGQETAQSGIRRRRQEGGRRRQADAAARRLPRAISRPTTCCSTTARSSRNAIVTARSSRSTARRSACRTRRPATSSPSCRCGRQAVRRLGSVRRRVRRNRSDSEHRRRGSQADGAGAGIRRLAVHQRQRQGQDLEGQIPRSARHVRRGATRDDGFAQDAAGAHPAARRAEGHPRQGDVRRRREDLRDLLRVVPPARCQGRWRAIPAAGRDQLGVGQQAAADLGCRARA